MVFFVLVLTGCGLVLDVAPPRNLAPTDAGVPPADASMETDASCESLTELCNRLDDDCDGAIDEDIADCMPGCDASLMLCNGACVDLSIDRNNCGGCNTVCQSSDRCVDSLCLPLATTEVSAGFEHTCAIVGSGQVFCWGEGGKGRLGDGDTVPRSSPSYVGESFSSVSAGAGSSCACDGLAQCWGELEGDSPVPVDVDEFSMAVDVSVGELHACAVLSDPSFMNTVVRCIGEAGRGRLGGPAGGAVQVYDGVALTTLVSARQVSVGTDHTCVRLAAGQVYCWGANDRGQAGVDGDDRFNATRVDGLGSGSTDVSAGDDHTCVVRADGRVFCWGNNNRGQLGPETPAGVLSNVPVSSGVGQAVDVDCGTGFSCAVRASGNVFCWGDGSDGRLGDPGLSGIASHEMDGDFSGVTAGDSHGCAWGLDGIVCWGRNDKGQLGLGRIDSMRTLPEPVLFY